MRYAAYNENSVEDKPVKSIQKIKIKPSSKKDSSHSYLNSFMTQAELTQSDITLSRKPTVDMTPREPGTHKKRPKGLENASEVANVK